MIPISTQGGSIKHPQTLPDEIIFILDLIDTQNKENLRINSLNKHEYISNNIIFNYSNSIIQNIPRIMIIIVWDT